ncbi:MAG: hypothetical protein ACE1ZA_15600, partial [Pseudomonadales bacterium]
GSDLNPRVMKLVGWQRGKPKEGKRTGTGGPDRSVPEEVFTVWHVQHHDAWVMPCIPFSSKEVR